MEALMLAEERLGKIRDELEKHFPTNNNVIDVENPVSLSKRLHSLSNRFARLNSKLVDLHKIRHELVRLCTSASMNHLKDLEHSANLLGVDAIMFHNAAKEAHDNFAQTARVEVEETEDFLEDNLLTTRDQLQEALLHEDAKAPTTQTGKAEDFEENLSSNANLQSSGNRTNFINQAAFQALPESIRGRAKQEQAERTLAIIQKHFQSTKRGEKRNNRKSSQLQPITIKQLDSMGAKVSGATGACILQTLRSLGFINISKAGIVLNEID